MVINPIVGVYIPIIRIPVIKGWMTIPNTRSLDPGTYGKWLGGPLYITPGPTCAAERRGQKRATCELVCTVGIPIWNRQVNRSLKGKRWTKIPKLSLKKTMYIVYIVYKFQHFLQKIVNFGGKDGKGRKQRETVQTLFGLFGGNQFVFVHRKIGVSTTKSNLEGWTNRNMIARSFSFSTIVARYYPPCN